MKTCTSCTRNEDGICSQYGKQPPASFAERCRHYEQGEEAAATKCEECGLHDADDTGAWCRLPIEGQMITYRPITEGLECPLI